MLPHDPTHGRDMDSVCLIEFALQCACPVALNDLSAPLTRQADLLLAEKR